MNIKKVHVAVLATLLSLVSCAKLDQMLHGPKPEKKFFTRVWNKNIDPSYITGNLPITTGSPLVYEDLVFVGALSGNFYAYQLETGRSLWEAYEGQALGAMPGFFRDMVIYGSQEGRVFARHYLSGKLIYSVDLGAGVESRPVFYKGRMFFHLRNHKIVSLDASTGKILWAYKRSVPNLTTLHRVSTPVIYDNKLFVGFADGHIATLSIEEGLLLWDKKIAIASKFLDVDMTPVFTQQGLFIGSLAGDLQLLDPRNGKQRKVFNLTVSRAPVFYKDQFYIGTTDGYLVKMSREGNVSQRLKLDKYSSVTNIIFWKGHLVATNTLGHLYQIDPETLQIRSRIHLGHDSSAIFGEIGYNSDFLTLLSSRNRVYTYK